MSLALYRKYRPQNFANLHGQSAAKETLMQALKQNKLSHAYLFAGPRGTGKTSSARLIAKAIQCETRQESGQSCGECSICKQHENNELIDLIEIDAASNRGIDEIRDLREKMRFAPSYAKSKVYIIDEVHMLTKEAFNALLKSLEEPPPHVYFILATTEIHKIPETIISRCQRYDFRRISVSDIVSRLKHIAEKEGMSAEPSALEMIAKHADGGMRDAISLLEQFSTQAITEDLIRDRLGLVSHQACDQLYGALGSSDTQKGLAIIEELHNDGYNLSQFTISFLGLLRSKLYEAIRGEKKAVVPKILNWIELFDDAWIKLKRASISQLPLEIAVIRATHNVIAPLEASDVQKATSTEPSKRPEGLSPLDEIKVKVSEAMSAIENPAIRNSFRAGNLASYADETLTFQFASKFHFDTVHSANAVLMIEGALTQILSKEVKVLCKLDDGVLASEVTSIDTLGWATTEEKI
ncbi:MAG: DNA polymerase-3 subunit gamma/tau [Oceanicoccus sp.]|jgi:DNA polymerase-3 subunit gamma/tau